MLLHADDESEWNISTITMKYLRVIYAIFTLSLPAPPSDTCGFLLAVCQIFHSYLACVAYYTMRFGQKTAKSTINRLKISKSSAAVGSGWGRWVRAIDTKQRVDTDTLCRCTFARHKQIQMSAFEWEWNWPNSEVRNYCIALLII